MQYNQLMTDIVFAIRTQLTPLQKQTIKTSNPELLGDLADIYHCTDDDTLRAHIEQLMSMAGATWSALLQPAPNTTRIPTLHRTPACNTLSPQEAVA